jgi:RNA 2',3'-cyclic 3'-phosphodiesterase
MPARSTARLFVAIDPPAPVNEALAAWARAAAAALGVRGDRDGGRALRLLDAGSLHLTICFLGSRPVAEVDSIATAISRRPRDDDPSPALSLGAPLWLPPRRPRSLAVEVHEDDRGAEQLVRLQHSIVESIAAAIDWQPERRRFRGHITVARVHARARRARFALDSELLPPTPRRSFTPAAVVLYRSLLHPSGATYEELASCALSAS